MPQLFADLASARTKRSAHPRTGLLAANLTMPGRGYAIARRDRKPMAVAGLWESYVTAAGDIIRTMHHHDSRERRSCAYP